MSSSFELDTRNMNTVATSCENLAAQMLDLKQSLDDAQLKLLQSWKGRGCESFQSKFHFLMTQLEDINEGLYEVAESIRNAEDSYIQTDMDIAKATNGIWDPTEG